MDQIEGLRVSRGSVVTMIIFIGAKGAQQERVLRVAMALLQKKLYKEKQIVLEIEYLNQDKVKNINKWDPEAFTDYLLSFDIHICPTHPHQGNVGKTPAWNIRNIYRHVERWMYHLGFFNSRYCRCPVLTQNKRGYLEPLPEICLPSLFIDIPAIPGALSNHNIAEIEAFVGKIEPLYGNRFCIKLSFVTHRIPKYGDGVTGILDALNEYINQEKLCGYYPYFIIQPRYDIITLSLLLC